MAVTITLDELKQELTVTDASQSTPDFTAAETRRLTRYRALAKRWVESYASVAPEDVQNEAVVRVCGYLLEIPNGPYTSLTVSGASGGYPSGSRAVFRHSGAMALLSPYKKRRAGVIG